VPFNLLQHADLSNWSGDLADSTFQKLLDKVASLANLRSEQVDAKIESHFRQESTPELPKDIPPARPLHGYSGKWKVKSVFSRWRNRDLGEEETVVFNGATLLCLDADGMRGTGMQVGVLYATLDSGYTETRYIGNQIIEARAEKDGILRLTIQLSHRPLVEPVRGIAPPDFGKDFLENLNAAPPFHIELKPLPGKAKYLEGKHWYDPMKRPYQLATEYWDYID